MSRVQPLFTASASDLFWIHADECCMEQPVLPVQHVQYAAVGISNLVVEQYCFPFVVCNQGVQWL